jgi:hypothetical protein
MTRKSHLPTLFYVSFLAFRHSSQLETFKVVWVGFESPVEELECERSVMLSEEDLGFFCAWRGLKRLL